MKIRFPDGSVIDTEAVPRNTQSKRRSKQSHGKIKWPSASNDSPDVIRSIYDEKVVERPKTRVVPDSTGMRDGKPFVPVSTNASYSFGRGAYGIVGDRRKK